MIRSDSPSRRTGMGVALALLVSVFATLVVAQSPASAAPAKAVTAAAQVGAPDAGAAAAPAGKRTKSVTATWSCNWSRSGNNVDSYCTVTSGYIQQWAYCAGWGYIYSGWFGPGSWHLWTYCNSYTLTSWGYQTSG